MRRYRWLILILLFPLYVWLLVMVGIVAIAFLFSPSEIMDFEFWRGLFSVEVWTHEILEKEISYWALIGPAILVALTQVLFLVAVLRPKPFVMSQGKSLKLSLISAALVASGLTIGLFFGLLELFQMWEPFMERQGNLLEQFVNGDERAFLLLLWIYLMVGWAVWTPLLFVFARRKKSHLFYERCIGLLLAGTILEVLVVVPIDIMVRRRTSCYCGTGSFVALCFSVWALLWLAGPGIVVALTSKRRRFWLADRCGQCGYLKGPSPGARCSECGFEWME